MNLNPHKNNHLKEGNQISLFEAFPIKPHFFQNSANLHKDIGIGFELDENYIILLRKFTNSI